MRRMRSHEWPVFQLLEPSGPRQLWLSDERSRNASLIHEIIHQLGCKENVIVNPHLLSHHITNFPLK